MKKLITITFVLLFTAGMAFGQSEADITQTGNSNEADITQSSDGFLIESTIQQVGENNSASAIVSGGVSNTRGATTEQIQNGNSNTAIADASSGVSQDMLISQFQSGNDNFAKSSNNSDAIVTQTQVGNDNRAISTLGKASDLTQWQQGNGNTAEFESTGTVTRNNEQIQIGDNNTSQVVGLYSRGSLRTTVQTYQEGNDNYVQANGLRGGNEVTSEQVGNGNIALFYIGSESNFASIAQNGNGNTATISQ